MIITTDIDQFRNVCGICEGSWLPGCTINIKDLSFVPCEIFNMENIQVFTPSYENNSYATKFNNIPLKKRKNLRNITWQTTACYAGCDYADMLLGYLRGGLFCNYATS